MSYLSDVVKLVVASYLRYNPFFNAFINSRPEACAYRNYVHQIYLLSRTMFHRPVRVLVADEIGLGKTVEAIRILKYLSMVDGVKRVLIAVPPMLLDQWLSLDLRNLGIRPIVIDKDSINGLLEKVQANQLPDGVYIGSMDKLKLSASDEVESTRYPYFEFVSSVDWDLVIIDEAHKLSYTYPAPTQRYERLGLKVCREKTKHCILLTATPHRGRTDDFLARLILLDGTLKPRPHELEKEVVALGLKTTLFQIAADAIIFRRGKEDVNVLERAEVFKPAHQFPVLIHVPEEIKGLQTKILDFAIRGLDRYYTDPEDIGIREVLRKLLIKRAMSSEKALLKTFMTMLAKRALGMEELRRLHDTIEKYLSGEEPEVEIDAEIEKYIEAISSFINPGLKERMEREIGELVDRVKEVIDKAKSPKIHALATIVELSIGPGELPENKELFRDVKGGKIIVFTEFRDTADQIFEQLLKVLEEKLSATRSTDAAKRFLRECRSSAKPIKGVEKYLAVLQTRDGKHIGIGLLTSESKEYLPIFQCLLESSQLDTAVLISTDVAAEGLNMQKANIIVNYEITWSYMKREQRLGRVWRLGQGRSVYVFDFYMGTDFESSILKNYSLKVVTVAEEVGYTTTQYKGIAIYIPQQVAQEDYRFALRVVEMEKYTEGYVIGEVATALRRAFTESGIDAKVLSDELVKLALQVVRLVREVKRELEKISMHRATPEQVRRVVKLLLGLESDAEALELAKQLLKLLQVAGLAQVEESGQTLYVNKKSVRGDCLRDYVVAIYEAVKDTIQGNLTSKHQPVVVKVSGVADFEYGFLTLLYVKRADKDVPLYVEPLLLVAKGNSKPELLRGARLAGALAEILEKGEAEVVEGDQLHKAVLSKYENTGRELFSFIDAYSRAIKEDKICKYLTSKELSKLRHPARQQEYEEHLRSCNELTVAMLEAPLVAFIFTPRVEREVAVPQIPPIVEGAPRGVSPRKKEIVKTISESLVKSYFEGLGYRVVKDGEYYPYDFKLCTDERCENVVAYVEVKGHETDETSAVLSQGEEEFAEKHKYKYIVCVVANVLTSPRILCDRFSNLELEEVHKEEVYKYKYKVKGTR